MFLFARRAVQCFICSRFIQRTYTGSRLGESSQHGVSRVENIALAPQSFVHLMSCCNLKGPPERRSTFPDRLETESGIPCIDPGGGGWFGGVAEQSPLTIFLLAITLLHA